MERRDHIIDVFMALIGERQFEEVTPRVIASEAGVTLAQLRAEFASRGHIIDAFAKRIDDVVLSGQYDDMADEPARERLFDVMMSRIEALKPYRLAMGELIAVSRRDPAVGIALNTLNVRSTAWDLAAAGLRAPGWRGRLAVQGTASSFVKVLRVFVQDDDAGLPRTMAALDKALREGESRHKQFARIFGSAVEPDPRPSVAPSNDAADDIDDGAAAQAVNGSDNGVTGEPNAGSSTV
ncbi:MAG: TetR/AcrR family transcriptional regulator [Pseudomonadota bacterium]